MTMQLKRTNVILMTCFSVNILIAEIKMLNSLGGRGKLQQFVPPSRFPD